MRTLPRIHLRKYFEIRYQYTIHLRVNGWIGVNVDVSMSDVVARPAVLHEELSSIISITPTVSSISMSAEKPQKPHDPCHRVETPGLGGFFVCALIHHQIRLSN